ncbi:predicted protein [Histoplasma capsulatum G186AR]|uniref:Uncharacterized protein n=1 Tax=Ajellomyces capsulatus (strain G186AR / H82 / ATCC MYA-2454 / RMSCC 2432) TaxID=447093 RepID=C0NRV2_AJECG|nr:uncharacterized protein HCBG_05882 [Histoplasma capsulatum G186AR]EEH05618.1 predicted protein [Histoplasma capsulatum G186AR]
MLDDGGIFEEEGNQCKHQLIFYFGNSQVYVYDGCRLWNFKVVAGDMTSSPRAAFIVNSKRESAECSISQVLKLTPTSTYECKNRQCLWAQSQQSNRTIHLILLGNSASMLDYLTPSGFGSCGRVGLLSDAFEGCLSECVIGIDACSAMCTHV